MRRFLAFAAAIIMVASLAGSTVASPPTYKVNHVVGDFDMLNLDGSLAGHVVVDYKEPTLKQWVPGTLDVTWVPGARFPFDQPPYGVKVSHTILTTAGFGFNDPDSSIQSGADGAMCDWGGYWNATCHDFQVIIKKFTNGTPNMIAFGRKDWGAYPNEWYLVGDGSFHMTYVGPIGS